MSENTYDLSQGWDSLAADLLYASMAHSSGNRSFSGPPEELDFYERHIRANGGLALDQACGTGRHLFPLVARGLEVHGADASADALRLAERASETSGLHGQFYHQKMEECDIPHRYDTIYIANCSFQLISDRLSVLRTLKRFRGHLVPGGELLVELFVPEEAAGGECVKGADNPDKWDPLPRHEAEGEIATTLWTESIDPFEQVLLHKRRYDLYVNGQCVHSETHELLTRWYAKYEFIMMLERAGFEKIFLYSDYTEQPATKDSKVIVYGAHRPRS